jgi:hypothetical protein
MEAACLAQSHSYRRAYGTFCHHGHAFEFSLLCVTRAKYDVVYISFVREYAVLQFSAEYFQCGNL